MFVRPNIAAMSGYEPGEQPQVGKSIKLNTNENPYPPSPRVIQAVREALETGLVRYPDSTATPFRHRAGEVLGVDPDWILCGNGSDDVLTIVIRSLVGEGQPLRTAYPTYLLYRTLAAIQGARCEEIPYGADWTLDAKFTKQDGEPRLAFLANPNNPSGTSLPPGRVRELAEALPCPLLVDEAYADFTAENCLDLVKRSPNVMVMRSMSKSYALAGLRFGFLIAQPDVIAELMKVKDSYNCDALAIAGATGAIDDQEWLSANVRQVIATRERMTVELSQLGFSVVPSQANFVWCSHPDKPAFPLYEHLKQHQILVRYMNYPNWGDGLRISVGTDDQIDACLTILADALS